MSQDQRDEVRHRLALHYNAEHHHPALQRAHWNKRESVFLVAFASDVPSVVRRLRDDAGKEKDIGPDGLKGIISSEGLAKQDAVDARDRDRQRGTATTPRRSPSKPFCCAPTRASPATRSARWRELAWPPSSSAPSSPFSGQASFSVETTFADEDAANSFVDANTNLCYIQFQQGGGGSDRDSASFTSAANVTQRENTQLTPYVQQRGGQRGAGAVGRRDVARGAV